MHALPSLDHVVALTDDVGIHQHASYDVPNRHEGYCTDDVARGFIVAIAALRQAQGDGEWAQGDGERARGDGERGRGSGDWGRVAEGLGRTYLAFLAHADRGDGRFRNFMSYERTWLDEAGTPDSNGRAIWALGFGLRFAPHEGWRRICADLLERAVPNVPALEFPRSRAYAALGLAHAFEASGRTHAEAARELRAIGAGLATLHAACASPDWDWFEDRMTYDNARLPEALLRIGTVLEDSALLALGLRTFAFYESVVMENDLFVPIGNDGWYERGSTRARYAQQPLEAAAFVDAALAAEAATGQVRFRRLAERGLAWFAGANTRGEPMTAGGGCYDGLEADAVNRNMGAESTLAYVASALALAAPAVAVVVRAAR